MGQQHTDLTMLTEAQRAEAIQHFHLIRPFLEDGVPLTRIAGEYQIPIRTLRRWVQRYRVDGLVGLSRPMRKDKDQRRAVTPQVQQFITGIVLDAVKKHDLDGVQFDDRLAWPVQFGYDDYTKNAYLAETGQTVPFLVGADAR